MASKLQLSVKNLAELGVLSKSDEKYIKDQIPEPGFFQSDAGSLGRLRQSGKNFDDDLIQTLAPNGYRPTQEFLAEMASSSSPGAGASAPAAPPPGKIAVSNGKETLYIDPADQAEAEADGYKVVR